MIRSDLVGAVLLELLPVIVIPSNTGTCLPFSISSEGGSVSIDSVSIVEGGSVSVDTGASLSVTTGASLSVTTGVSLSVTTGDSVSVTMGASVSVTAGASVSVTTGVSLSVTTGVSLSVTSGVSLSVTEGVSLSVTSAFVEASTVVSTGFTFSMSHDEKHGMHIAKHNRITKNFFFIFVISLEQK